MNLLEAVVYLVRQYSLKSPRDNMNANKMKIIGYGVTLLIYRLYFHPLSGYKGPKLFATTNLIHIWYTLRGQWVHKVSEMHEQYGPVSICSELIGSRSIGKVC